MVILVVTILIPYGSSELSVGVDGTIGIDLIPVTPTNYSTISTKYSTYSGDAHLFDGYSSSGLYSYYKSMFDSVYATISSLANYLPLTGGTLTGNLTAPYFIGNGSLLTGIDTPTPTLQEVTDAGSTTTNDITLSKDGTTNLNLDTAATSDNDFATLSFKDKNALRYAWIFRQATDDFYLYDYLNAKIVMRYDQSKSDLLLGESGNVDVVAGNDLNVLGTLDVTGDTNIIGNSNVDGLSQSDMFQPTHLNTGSSTTYKRLVGANGGFVSNIGVTGAMVITIPENKNEMFTMHIKGFNYETTHSTWSIDFSAYTRDDGGTWLKDSAIVHGNLPNNLIRVAVNSDNKKYLIIGDVDSVWRYPLVTIDTEVAFATSDWTTGVTYEYLEVLPDTDVELREVAGQVDYKFDGIDVKEDYSIGGANIIISNNLDVNGITTMNGEGRVVPADDNDDAFNVRNTADTADRIRMGLVTGDGRLQVLDDGGNVHVNLQGDADNYFMNNVGIGTATPDVKLEISGPSNNRRTIKITDSISSEEVAIRHDGSVGDLRFMTTNGGSLGTKMTIKQDGDVGIGTTNPDAKLQVSGDIHINDNYKFLYGTGKDASETFDGTTRISNAELGSPEYNWTNYGGYNFDNNITSDEYILGKNQVTQYHRNATIDTTSANTWVNVTWDLTIDEETTSGYLLTDSNASIVIENTGIYRIQGCLHPKNNGLGNQEAKLYSRILINGVEARCLQFANSKEFKTTGIDTMPFIGTIYAEAGQKVQLQYYVTSLNIDFEGDAVFDDGVAGSINFERISK